MAHYSPQQQLEHRLYRHFNKAIGDYGLIDEGDRIMIGLSGGKDSLALLEMLSNRTRIFRPKFSIEALHVRMSNIDYQTDTTYLEHFASSLNVPLTIVQTGFDATTDLRKSPCFLCSWNRRKTLFAVAQEHGCNKIALGHHQDDILHTTLLNLCFQGQFSTMPALLKMQKFPITIIRPLCLIHEEDLTQWSNYRHYEKQLKQCPYENDSHRADIRRIYKELEALSPEVRYSLWHALEVENKLIEG